MEEALNIKNLYESDKKVAATTIFKGENSIVNSIHLAKESTLKEHITKIPALLFCLSGNIIYSDETNLKIKLSEGDYFHIKPNVIHKLDAIEDSELLLIK